MRPSDLFILALGLGTAAIACAFLVRYKRSWIEIALAGTVGTCALLVLNRLAPPVGAVALVAVLALGIIGTLVSVWRTPPDTSASKPTDSSNEPEKR